ARKSEVRDAYKRSFHSEFYAVFSNAALHWMKRDPDLVLQRVRRSLKLGARFAGEMGGHGCVAAIVVALCATLEKYGVLHPASLIPWYFPTVGDCRSRPERAGFRLDYVA